MICDLLGVAKIHGLTKDALAENAQITERAKLSGHSRYRRLSINCPSLSLPFFMAAMKSSLPQQTWTNGLLDCFQRARSKYHVVVYPRGQHQSMAVGGGPAF